MQKYSTVAALAASLLVTVLLFVVITMDRPSGVKIIEKIPTYRDEATTSESVRSESNELEQTVKTPDDVVESTVTVGN